MREKLFTDPSYFQVLALVISALAACDIIKSIQEHAAGTEVPVVDFLSPLVLVLTMVGNTF